MATEANVDGIGSPLYARIATNLREQILAGKLASGARLAGEVALAQQLNVSRPTIRGALALLQREELIVTQQGIGSFVLPRRVRQTLAHLETLDTTLAEQGVMSHTRILEFLFTTPDPGVSAALNVAADEDVLLVKRVHVVQDEPIAYVQMAIPSKIGVHLSRRDVEEHALYELLPERLGVQIGPATQTVRAEAVTRDIAAVLHVAEGAPLLVCERVTCSADCEPVIYALFHYRADRFEFRASLSAHEWRVPWSSPGLVLSTGGEHAG